MARPLVMIGTPCFGGLVTHGFMQSVCTLIRDAAAAGIDIELALLPHDALITRARSVIVGHFLDRPDATHLLFIDADISFGPEQFFRMLRFDKAFVAGLYPVKTIDWEAVPRRVVQGETLRSAGLTYVGDLCSGDELERDGEYATGRYAGTGFQLLQRSVFERMIRAYGELKFKGVHVLNGRIPASDHYYALFDCTIDPVTGVYLSEDYAFCQRWRALGGQIWLDLRSRLTHTGAQPFEGDLSSRPL